MSALGRASTLSLGSIALGSLIVTLLDIVRLILTAVQNNASADGHREWSERLYQSSVLMELSDDQLLRRAWRAVLRALLGVRVSFLFALLIALADAVWVDTGIESAVEYFNRYAYIEIALYGKSYVPAARDTWRLFKDRGTYDILSPARIPGAYGDWYVGIDALVNDSLVSMTLTWGAYIVGICSSLFAYLYLRCELRRFFFF